MPIAGEVQGGQRLSISPELAAGILEQSPGLAVAHAASDEETMKAMRSFLSRCGGMMKSQSHRTYSSLQPSTDAAVSLQNASFFMNRLGLIAKPEKLV